MEETVEILDIAHLLQKKFALVTGILKTLLFIIKMKVKGSSTSNSFLEKLCKSWWHFSNVPYFSSLLTHIF